MITSHRLISLLLAGALGATLVSAVGCSSADTQPSSEPVDAPSAPSDEQDSDAPEADDDSKKAEAAKESKETKEPLMNEASPAAIASAVGENLSSLEEVEAAAMQDVEDAVAYLQAGYDELVQEIDSYDAYVANVDKVENYYQEVVSVTEETCINLRARAANYTELILSSDMPNDDKYDALEGLEDYIYDDAADVIEKDIYDGILDDMEKAFYSGVLDDSDDAPSYDDWYDARSDEYGWWYDARSDVYEAWYDVRGDIYELYYDERSETFSGDIDRAWKKLDNFKADVEKMAG